MNDTTRWIIIAIVVLVAGIAFWMLLPQAQDEPQEEEISLEEKIERGEIPPPPPPPAFFEELEGSTTTPEELMLMASTSGVMFVE